MSNFGFGGGLLGNVLTVMGFLGGYLLSPTRSIWAGVGGAAVGYLISYIIRKITLPKSRRIIELAEKIAGRAKADGATRLIFNVSGVHLSNAEGGKPLSMAAFGGEPLKDIIEVRALIDALRLLLPDFLPVKGAYPPELRQREP